MSNKDKTFADFMKKTDEPEQAELWCYIMESAKMFEDRGFSRQTVCEGILKAILDLAHKREDEKYFQKTNDARRFYLWASQFTKQRFDSFISYPDQREAEKRFGKDNLAWRDASLHGWRPIDSSDPESNH